MTAHRDPDIQPAPDRAAETLSAMRPADVPAHLHRHALDAVPPEPDPSETATPKGADPQGPGMTYRLYCVTYRTNHGTKTDHTAIVWARRIADAVAIVEDYETETPGRHLHQIRNVTEIRPPLDLDQTASIVWTTKGEPHWP